MGEELRFGVFDRIKEELKAKSTYRVNPLTDTVQTGVTQILRQNANRLAWLIINLSDYTIYVGFDEFVSATRGISLGPRSYLMMRWDEDYIVATLPVYAISPSGVATIYLVEVVML